MKTCESCRHFKYGACFAHPPVLVVLPGAADAKTVRPDIRRDSPACGEWAEVERPTQERSKAGQEALERAQSRATPERANVHGFGCSCPMCQAEMARYV